VFDSWEEEEAEDEARSGGELSASEPAFTAPLAVLERHAAVAAQSAIRSRATLPEEALASYDSQLEAVRALLAGGSAPAAEGRGSLLAPLVGEARSCALAISSAFSNAFAAELAAVELAAACSVPVLRAEDGKRWMACEAVASAALDRAARCETRRLREASAVTLAHLSALAASLAAGLPCMPGAGTPWPASCTQRAALVSDQAARAGADTLLLHDAFAAAVARLLTAVEEAGLLEPAARLRERAAGHTARRLVALECVADLRTRALACFLYILIAPGAEPQYNPSSASV